MKVATNNEMMSTIALAALHTVNDPEIGLNIVDLGLVFKIDFIESDKKIIVTMTLTTQYCPMGESITNAASAALTSVFKDYTVEVNLTYDPPWIPEMISDEGKKFLNL